MAARNFVAFDLGARKRQGGPRHARRASSPSKKSTASPTPCGRMNGHLFWNLLGQWEELKTGLRKATSEPHGKRRPTSLHGIGVDTWGVDFGFIGRDGPGPRQPLSLPRQPHRRPDGAHLQARPPRKNLSKPPASSSWSSTRSTNSSPCAKPNRRVLESAETLLFMPDLFNFLFSGERKSGVLHRLNQPDVRPAPKDLGHGAPEATRSADAHPPGGRALGNHPGQASPRSGGRVRDRPGAGDRPPPATTPAVPSPRSPPKGPTGATSAPARGP